MVDVLSYSNNWEADEYFVNGNKIRNLMEVEFNGVNYPVHSRIISIPYNDMGHVYHGTSSHYFINQTVLGVDIEIDLNTIVSRSSKIIATQYSLA